MSVTPIHPSQRKSLEHITYTEVDGIHVRVNHRDVQARQLDDSNIALGLGPALIVYLDEAGRRAMLEQLTTVVDQ